MIFIIDGYNLIKTIFKKPYVTSKEIGSCVLTISCYITKRQHTAIIVFDGFNNLSYKHNNMIDIIYSKNQSADDYIKNYINGYIKNNKASNLLVITSDQEIATFARRLDIESVDSYSFYHKINKGNTKHNIVNSIINTKFKKSSGQIYKLNNNQDDTPEDLELDILMQNGCKNIMHKEQDYDRHDKQNNQLNSNKSNKKRTNKILKKI